MLDKNTFGELVKAYRLQRGWTQEELAERWEHSRGYVAQIERGQRKLERTAQVIELADILGIPSEKLDAIGRGIPERRTEVEPSPQSDAKLFQLLLAPSRDAIRLSYMVWLTDHYPMIEENLRELIFNLDTALTAYHGEFMKPAQQLLAYAHQATGKIAFDRLDFAAAGGHFSAMMELGQALNDPDIIALGMVRQGDVLRKRGRYDTALRCFEASKPYADVADQSVQGIYYLNIARAYYFLGNEQSFLRAINPALNIAAGMEKRNNGSAYWFNLDVALQFQASGYTALLKPEKAIEIYKEIGRSRLSRPLRDQGAFTIEKARAYLEAGEMQKGIELSLRGLQFALAYRSKRHIARLEATYKRLSVTRIGKEKRLNDLRDALRDAQQHIDWEK